MYTEKLTFHILIYTQKWSTNEYNEQRKGGNPFQKVLFSQQLFSARFIPVFFVWDRALSVVCIVDLKKIGIL
jgi:hypothetical protein